MYGSRQSAAGGGGGRESHAARQKAPRKQDWSRTMPVHVKHHKGRTSCRLGVGHPERLETPLDSVLATTHRRGGRTAQHTHAKEKLE